MSLRRCACQIPKLLKPFIELVLGHLRLATNPVLNRIVWPRSRQVAGSERVLLVNILCLVFVFRKMLEAFLSQSFQASRLSQESLPKSF